MNKNKGFTLIELLVVIAIIGILSSVVLASLNSARAKGGDAAVRSNLANIRTQAAIFTDNGGVIPDSVACNSGALFTDPVISKQVSAAVAAGGGNAVCNSKAAAPGSWAVQVPLKSVPSVFACADSSGITSTSTTALGTGISPAVCP